MVLVVIRLIFCGWLKITFAESHRQLVVERFLSASGTVDSELGISTVCLSVSVASESRT